ncbi:hypothetical protein LINPERHAP2_LOCUS375 [Linum perenne]
MFVVMAVNHQLPLQVYPESSSVKEVKRSIMQDASGPWLIGDHYVVLEEWRPNFEPGYSQVNTIRAWVRLSGLLLENFDVGILKLVGYKIEKTIRVDDTTLFCLRGNYVRMEAPCVVGKPSSADVTKGDSATDAAISLMEVTRPGLSVDTARVLTQISTLNGTVRGTKEANLLKLNFVEPAMVQGPTKPVGK